jgi:hypothetical protein
MSLSCATALPGASSRVRPVTAGRRAPHEPRGVQPAARGAREVLLDIQSSDRIPEQALTSAPCSARARRLLPGELRPKNSARTLRGRWTDGAMAVMMPRATRAMWPRTHDRRERAKEDIARRRRPRPIDARGAPTRPSRSRERAVQLTASSARPARQGRRSDAGARAIRSRRRARPARRPRARLSHESEDPLEIGRYPPLHADASSPFK